MFEGIKNTINLGTSIVQKIIKNPELLKKNLTRKVFNRIFTSNLKRDKYDIVQNVTEFKEIVFPKFADPLVSIIVPAYNKWEYTYACFLTIFRNIKNVSYEVILADDVSTDETQHATMYVKNFIYIRNTENLRFLKNNNNAAKYAKGKYIVFLNNDTNVQKNWLESMVALAESDPSIGIVGSKLIYPDGRLQEAGNIMWSDGIPENYGNLFNPNNFAYNYVKEVDSVSAASMLTPRKLWEELGGFNEELYPAYYEDTDYCFKVHSAGYKVMYQPLSEVIHFEGVTHGRDVKSSWKAYQVVNHDKFAKKWAAILKTDHLEPGQNTFLARDRSQNKKTILVIDSRVPLYDQEAGSRSTYNYLKLFVQMGLNVKFISNSLSRYEPYTTDLQQLGIEVLYAHTDNWRQWIQENAKYIDFTYIHRPDIAETFLPFIKEHTTSKIIYQTHDLHYLREQRRYEIEKDPGLLKTAEKMFPLEKKICESADVVLTFSSYEQDIITKTFAVKQCKTIPLYLYESFTEEPEISFDRRHGLLFVGGFGHYPNRDGIIWFVEAIFPYVQKEIPEIQLIIIGSNPPSEVKALANENIIIRPNVTDAELAQAHFDSRLLIVPLRYGAGVKGKVVDALYHGVPMVSTIIGVEGIEHIGDIMTPTDTTESFANEIIKQYRDTEGLKIISGQYRSFAKKYFSFEYAEAVFNSILDIKET